MDSLKKMGGAISRIDGDFSQSEKTDLGIYMDMLRREVSRLRKMVRIGGLDHLAANQSLVFEFGKNGMRRKDNAKLSHEDPSCEDEDKTIVCDFCGEFFEDGEIEFLDEEGLYVCPDCLCELEEEEKEREAEEAFINSRSDGCYPEYGGWDWC